MKKSITRALSLLLVLVMILGAMPMAMAEATASLTVTADKTTAKVGETVTFTAELPDGYTALGAFSWSGAVGSGNVATAEMTESGLSVSVTVRASGEAGKVELNGSASVSVDDSDIEKELTGIQISGNSSMSYGTNQTLSITPMPAGAKLPADAEIVWTSSNPVIATVYGNKNGTATVTANEYVPNSNTVTITASYGTMSDTFTITITKPVAQVTVSPSSMTLSPSQSQSLYIQRSPAGTMASYIDLTVTPVDSTIVSVRSGGSNYTVTGLKAGKTKIRVYATIDAVEHPGFAFADGSYIFEQYVDVTVNDEYRIECANMSELAGTKATVTPVLFDGNNKAVTDATFSVSTSLVTDNVNYRTFTFTSNYPGVYKVTFTANGIKDKNGNAITKDINISYYNESSLEVSLKQDVSTFYFKDTNKLSSAKSSYQKNYSNLTTLSLEDLISSVLSSNVSNVNQINYYVFGEGSFNGGDLLTPTSGLGSNWTSSTKAVEKYNLGTVGFRQKSTTDKISTYTVSAIYGTVNDGVIVGQLNLTINAGAVSNGIQYTTTATTPVTFKVSDFQSYWNANINKTNSTLSYVRFNVSSNVPSYGDLYTTSTKAKEVTNGMKFTTTTPGANSSNYALANVTYVPDATKTTSYTVDIPFTAYGGTNDNDTVSGYVTINLNDKGNTIGARGTDLSGKLAEGIATTYYSTKGETLSHVIFDLPSVQKATLFRSIPKKDGYNRVTDAVRVIEGDKFYYSTKTTDINKMDLSDVTIIPAAGYKGKLTLEYTAYNAGNAAPMTGTITFDVQTSTTSAAFSDVKGTYSWAADSADFLYYEGTAQGSNGKYNPSANITRGDFMLMLYRAFLAEDYGTTAVTTNFPDVVKGSTPYSQETYQAVGVAKQLGIAQGSNDKFNPKAYITREEAMVLINRTLEKCSRNLRYASSTKASSFSDYSKVSSWATAAISELVSHGVIQGSNDRIVPKSNITRAEMACILHRVITY